MIISASRRTDIPSCYPEWMYNRLKEKYVLVRNPMNAHRISRIDLSPDAVDAIVFWTKNPTPMMNRLDELSDYCYYFQVTLTAYGPEVETNLPSKNKVIIPGFEKLSKEIGKEKVVWRYDPIFFSERYTIDYHCKYFEVLASKLGGYTEKCTVSFLDLYKNTERNLRPLRLQKDTYGMQSELLERFAEIAGEYGLSIDTCAETGDFSRLGVGRASCIDRERIERTGGFRLNVSKDKNQRAECGCVSSIDIGTYHTCKNGCLYCYANKREQLAYKNFRMHDPDSPLLFGSVGEADVIKDREVKSLIERQMTLEDCIVASRQDARKRG